MLVSVCRANGMRVFYTEEIAIDIWGKDLCVWSQRRCMRRNTRANSDSSRGKIYDEKHKKFELVRLTTI